MMFPVLAVLLVPTVRSDIPGVFTSVVSTLANVSRPSSIALDGLRGLVVAAFDNSTLLRVSFVGAAVALAGAPRAGNASTFLDGTGTAARFFHPTGVSVASDGSVFVADFDNGALRVAVPDPSAPGAPPYTVTTPQGAGARNSWVGPKHATLRVQPACVAAAAAVDDCGLATSTSLLLTDTASNAVLFVDVGASPTVTHLAGDGFGAPTSGRWVDRAGPGSANASFFWPWGLAEGSNGTFYVADAGNNAVRFLLVRRCGTEASAMGVGTVAGAPFAAPGFSDGVATAARFRSPRGVAVGPNGTIYVADTGNNAVRLIHPSRAVVTLAGGAAPGARDGPGAAALLWGPVALAVSTDGFVVYVADTGNGRICQLDLAVAPFSVTPTPTPTVGVTPSPSPLWPTPPAPPPQAYCTAAGVVPLPPPPPAPGTGCAPGYYLALNGDAVLCDAEYFCPCEALYKQRIPCDPPFACPAPGFAAQPPGWRRDAAGFFPAVFSVSALALAADGSGVVIVGDAASNVVRFQARPPPPPPPRASPAPGDGFSVGAPLAWPDVFAYNASQHVSTDGVGSSARFFSVRAVAAFEDASAAEGGGALVADGDRLRFVRRSGLVTTLSPPFGRASCACGAPGFGESGNCTAAMTPLTCALRGVASADGGDTLFASDGAVGAVFAMNRTEQSYTAVGGVGAFSSPAGLAAGSNGTLFVADFGGGALLRAARSGGAGTPWVVGALPVVGVVAPWAVALDEARGLLFYTDVDRVAPNATAVFSVPINISGASAARVVPASVAGGDCAFPGNATLAVEPSGALLVAGGSAPLFFRLTPVGAPRVITMGVGDALTRSFHERALSRGGLPLWGASFFSELAPAVFEAAVAAAGLGAADATALAEARSASGNVSDAIASRAALGALAPAADSSAAFAFFSGGGATYAAGWAQRLGAPAGLSAIAGDCTPGAVACPLYTATWAPLAAFLANVSAGSNGTTVIEDASEKLLKGVVEGAAAQALAAAQCGAATIRVYRVWAAPLWGRVGLVRVAITVSGGQEAALACAANAVAGPQFRNALLTAVEAALAKAAAVELFAFLSGPLVIVVGAAVGGTLFCLGCCGYVLRKPPCSSSGGKVGAEK